jgi:hypothetical protein
MSPNTVGKFSPISVAQVAALLLLLQTGCGGSSPSTSEEVSASEGKVNCSSLEPENPYDDESGHDAGYKWALEHNPGFCNGNSTSFEEGCEEYLRQVEAFQECENRR